MTDMVTREQLRAADADRDAVVERLGTALSEGRLQMDEYHERLENAHAAKTYADLDGLVADLPSPAPPVRVAQQPVTLRRRRSCCW